MQGGATPCAGGQTGGHTFGHLTFSLSAQRTPEAEQQAFDRRGSLSGTQYEIPDVSSGNAGGMLRRRDGHRQNLDPRIVGPRVCRRPTVLKTKFI